MRVDIGTTNIGTAGTRVQIGNTTDRVLWARFRGRPGNTGNVAVGISDVSMTDGWTLDNADDIGLTLDFRAFGGSVPLSSFWVDAVNNNDKVEWAFILE